MSVQAGSDTFNSALARAKEIAAKIQSSKDLNVNGSQDFDTRKRSFNGEDQTSPISKRPMMDGEFPSSDGGYMNQNNNSVQGNLKDEIRVPGSVIQYLSGETLGRLQAQTGCQIQLPPPGPDPSAERSITLSGNRQCIEHCKEQIKGIIHQYAPETHIGGIPTAGGEMMMNQQMGPVETVDMLIPQNKVGLVIGRGGETIKDLAVQSGCKMNMVQDGMYQQAPEKPLRMHGTPYQIQKARELVSGILTQQEFQNRNNFGGHSNFQQNQGPFEATANLPVSKELVGAVIGRGGDRIKRLQSETGANVKFNTIDPNAAGDRYLVIQGTKAQVEEVEARVKDLLGKVEHKDSHNRFNGPGMSQDVYMVPANKCGLVIGKKGETINRMKQNTGAHIEMDKNSPHDAPAKQFFIKGAPEQIAAAKEEISKIIGDGGGNPYGYGGPGGGGGGGGGGFQQQQQPGGHGGYGGQMGGQPGMMPGQDPAAMAYQQQMAYYQQYYQQQQMAAPAASAAPAAAQPAASAAPSAAPTTTASAGGNVQQQWAAYYQQLVQMYGEQQAQVYWTQLSQQQAAAQPQ